MPLYHSRPATVGAWLYDGSRESRNDLLERLGHNGRADVGADAIILMVCTNNGWVELKPGHYLVKGVSDFYPCDPETFEARWVRADRRTAEARA